MMDASNEPCIILTYKNCTQKQNYHACIPLIPYRNKNITEDYFLLFDKMEDNKQDVDAK
jgi:hypothetical protein